MNKENSTLISIWNTNNSFKITIVKANNSLLNINKAEKKRAHFSLVLTPRYKVSNLGLKSSFSSLIFYFYKNITVIMGARTKRSNRTKLKIELIVVDSSEFSS